MESVVPLSAKSLTAGSLSGRVAWAQGPSAAAPDTDCASELSLAGGAAAVAPCAASVGSAGGPQGVGVLSASATGAVRDCPDRARHTDGAAPGLGAAPESTYRRRVATSSVPVSRSLRSFALALLVVALTVLSACAVAPLIAKAFYGYGGLR